MDTFTGATHGYQRKEIPREPLYPKLSKDEEIILENMIFRQNDKIQKVDALFVFGAKSHKNEQIDFIQGFVHDGGTENIIISGGVPDVYLETLDSESSVLAKNLEGRLSKKINYFLEETSTNSYENALFANKIGFFDGYQTIGFLCPAHVSRRDFGYLKGLLKDKNILQFAIPYIYNGFSIDQSNWKDNDNSKMRVWGEFLRLYKYGLEYGNFDVSDIYHQMKKLEKYI